MRTKEKEDAESRSREEQRQQIKENLREVAIEAMG